MVDHLVMLLSTDWFEPYWNTLDIDANEVSRSTTRRGCREIVGQVLSGAENYYLISFAPERISKTRHLLQSLAHNSGTGETLHRLIDEWDNLSDEDEKAAWIWDDFTSSLFSGRVRGIEPRLDPAITEIMFAEHKTYDMEPYEFAAICETSGTAWDQYTRTLTLELPTALGDKLSSVLTARRFEAFWRSVRKRLTATQSDDLISWYRKMAKARERRDIIPSCAR